MNAHNHNVTINPGKNAWLITRTDRDQADAGAVVESSGPFLNRVLNQASPAGLRGIFQVLHTGPQGGRFVIGACRPLFVTASQDRPPVPEGLRVVGKNEASPLPRRVRGQRPWFLSVVFEWHGGVVRLPWPNHFASVLGSELVSDLDLDWLLLEQFEAVQP